MALLDLSQVTRALVRLVDEAIKTSPVVPTGSNSTIVVTSLPPDLLKEENSIGIYLYHIVEEAALKNQPWRGRPEQPIRYSPMGLALHYVVSANSHQEDEKGPYRDQLLMGMAIKALHDYPVIDDFTEIGGVKILPPEIAGDENSLRLSLRHVPVTEAVSYWTAGSQPLRLSAYYEVSMVIVEPDEPRGSSSRVLTYGVETFIGGLPRLSTSRSVVSFAIPGEATPRSVEVQPAQPAIGDEVTLVGSGLGGGAIELRVRGPGWADARPVGPTWGVSGAGDRVFATVQDAIDDQPALPGAYTASLAITRTTQRADGTTGSTTVLSNETPFQIAPRVDPIGAPAADGVFAVTGGLFADAGHPDLVVRASIADLMMTPGTGGALAPGEFAVISPTQLELRLPAGAAAGQWLPVRVTIGGSESPPRWVQVP